jgi:hypothetical protein
MYWPSLKPQVHWQNAQTWKQEVLSCQKMNQHSFYSNKLFSRHCKQPSNEIKMALLTRTLASLCFHCSKQTDHIWQ